MAGPHWEWRRFASRLWRRGVFRCAKPARLLRQASSSTVVAPPPSMPSQPLASDVVPIALVSVVLAFVSTLYPSWRASRIDPAEALRHE
jgi:ABC-type lipoprotein release transport system permease subunit